MVLLNSKERYGWIGKHLENAVEEAIQVRDIDYEDGAGTDLFAMDVALSGPIIGLNISW